MLQTEWLKKTKKCVGNLKKRSILRFYTSNVSLKKNERTKIKPEKMKEYHRFGKIKCAATKCTKQKHCTTFAFVQTAQPHIRQS